MALQTFISSEILSIFKAELIKNSRFNRNLVVGVIANIPTPLIFIPYVTQVISIILIIFHTINYPWYLINGRNCESYEKVKILGIPILYVGFIVSIIVLQLLWIPFMTQTISVILFGIYLLLLSRKKYIK